ncbi:MAG: glycoside hydrolase, partial [Flavisolibacter sp.]|nr:glycoside hydrolase [Flavisolibacter sp.]
MEKAVPTALPSGLCTEAAKKVLLDNNRGGYTIPSPRLYPFQWSWDSGFIALGLSYFDKQKAYDEIRNMFKGQWSNGMLPHINFHHVDPNYFPGPDVWGTRDCRWAPKGLATSGITQPPVFGFILSMMAKRLGDDEEFIQLIKEIFPKIVLFHRYLYQYRDPHNEGLAYIDHNWESGTDNSPLWDEAFEKIDVSNARDVSALRRDLKSVDAAQRPTNENYKRYIYLVDLFKECSYDDKIIYERCPFIIQDVLFNAILIRSNEALIELAQLIGEDTSEIKMWNQKTITSLNRKCWDEQSGFYFDFDLKKNALIKIKTSNGLMPLFAGVCSSHQASLLKDVLLHSFKSNKHLLCPSTATDEGSFNPVKYWRGPVWINVNWMLYHGLKRYGYEGEA